MARAPTPERFKEWGACLARSLPEALAWQLKGPNPDRGLFQLAGAKQQPSKDDIELHEPHICAALEFAPDHIPGMYELAAVLVHCDVQMEGKLYKADGAQEVLGERALADAKIYKRLLQAARRLTRRSWHSRSPELQRIKATTTFPPKKRKFGELCADEDRKHAELYITSWQRNARAWFPQF